MAKRDESIEVCSLKFKLKYEILKVSFFHYIRISFIGQVCAHIQGL